MPISSNRRALVFRQLFAVIAAIVWASIIWYLSSRPHLRVASDDLVDLITRKSAHLLAFGMLLVIVERALRRAAQPQTTTIAIAWLVTLTWAAIDEYHQTFVPGRVGHTTDVMIDMVGASIAAAVLLWKRDRSEKGLP